MTKPDLPVGEHVQIQVLTNDRIAVVGRALDSALQGDRLRAIQIFADGEGRVIEVTAAGDDIDAGGLVEFCGGNSAMQIAATRFAWLIRAGAPPGVGHRPCPGTTRERLVKRTEEAVEAITTIKVSDLHRLNKVCSSAASGFSACHVKPQPSEKWCEECQRELAAINLIEDIQGNDSEHVGAAGLLRVEDLGKDRPIRERVTCPEEDCVRIAGHLDRDVRHVDVNGREWGAGETQPKRWTCRGTQVNANPREHPTSILLGEPCPDCGATEETAADREANTMLEEARGEIKGAKRGEMAWRENYQAMKAALKAEVARMTKQRDDAREVALDHEQTIMVREPKWDAMGERVRLLEEALREMLPTCHSLHNQQIIRRALAPTKPTATQKHVAALFSPTTPAEEPKQEIVYWDCDDGAEILEHTDQDEAIGAHLDQLGEPGITPAAFLKVLEDMGELEVFGYHRMEVTFSGGHCLEDLLEHLDENLGDPNGDGATASPSMKAAEETFLAAVIAEYKPWACEQSTSEKVDPVAWVKENNPEWLETEEPAAEPERCALSDCQIRVPRDGDLCELSDCRLRAGPAAQHDLGESGDE